MLTQTCTTAAARTNKPLTGGIFSIVSGGITLLFDIFAFIIFPSRAFGGLLFALLGASILAIIGGILAVRRREWFLSLIGAIVSIGSFTGLLGVTAVVLRAISRKEFDKPFLT